MTRGDSFKNESAASAHSCSRFIGCRRIIGWSAVLLPGVALIIYPKGYTG